MYTRNQRQAMFNAAINPAVFAQIDPALIANPWKLMQALLHESIKTSTEQANQANQANAEANTEANTSTTAHTETAKPVTTAAPKLQPAVDVFDTGAAYLIEANLPGVKREDVALSLEGRTIKLSAKLSGRENDAKALWHERAVGEISRTITLPGRINSEEVQAKLEDGVLSITVAKANEAQPKHIVVQG
jgi:HSP20 family protein